MTTAKDSSPAATAIAFLEGKATQPGPQPLNPMDHLAYALILDAVESPEAALAAITLLRKTFIDWNEIRVARIQEVARGLGGEPWAEETALRIIEEYNAFFEKRGSLSYDFLASAKAAEGRKLLQQFLPRLRKGAYALLVFQHTPGASMPLSDEAVKAAKKHGIAAKAGDRGQLSRTLQDALDMDAICRLLQYLEIEATGNPYGEAFKAGSAAKSRKPTTVKAKKKK
ncbi:MAG: hypothetical protein LBJ46_03990 [Planctomycetota bacterium]|jgi:hypothetical protein|nr:hypothetical protein [Planctomycetota bacterium]